MELAGAEHGTIVLVHTVPPLIAEFAELSTKILPNVRILNILDEPLLHRIERQSGSSQADSDRLLGHLEAAASLGVDAALVTCSTLSLLVDHIRDRVPMPVVKIDEAMAEQAVRLGPQIVLLTTNETTGEPSRQLIGTQAAREGRQVEVRTVIVPGALQALLQGDTKTHDRLVWDAILQASASSQAIVLAQASMARVTRRFRVASVPVPILTSPELALRRVASVISNRQLMAVRP